jgi:AbrB family looped-hinge helix DNA binding protein
MEDTDTSGVQYEITSRAVRLRERGQLTIPRPVREALELADGDMLALVQVGGVIVLSPKQPQVPMLADKFVRIMEDEGVSLAELLSGLKEEREALWRERKARA